MISSMRGVAGQQVIARALTKPGRYVILLPMKVPGHPRIAINPEVCGGRPIVAGTRVRVTDVLEMLAGGASAAEIVEDFPYLREEDVRAVLAYAAATMNHSVVLAAA